MLVAWLVAALGGRGAAAPTPWRVAESFAVSPAPSRDDVSALEVSLVLEGEYCWSGGTSLGAAWGATWAHITSPATGALGALDPGNLMLGGGYAFDVGALHLKMGARLGAPLAIFWGNGVTDKRASEFNHSAAAAARGERLPWLWQLNAAPVGLDLQLTLAPTDGLSVTARLEPTALISVNSRPSRLALHAEVEAAAALGALTLRLGWGYLVSTSALENTDRDQHSVWGGGDLAVGHAHHVTVDVNVNLDGPYGVASGEAKPTWGLVLGARHAF